MAATVLDSYALLAYLRDEPGADKVQAIFEKAEKKGNSVLMTEVSYAETKDIVLRKDGGKAWAVVCSALESLPLEFVPTTKALADIAADFKANHHLSLADAFAAALAKERRGELVAGSIEVKMISEGIKINWLL